MHSSPSGGDRDNPLPPAPVAFERHVMINGLFVHVMIGVTAALVVAMTALIFYRSQATVEPTAAIIVQGDKQEVGSIISVQERDPLTGVDSHEVARTTLSSDNQYVTPILVEPGDYRVIATSPDGETLVDEAVRVPNLRIVTIELPTSIVVIGSPTFSGAKVAVSGDGRTRAVKELSAENSFRVTFYRRPGTDQVTVTRNGKVLLDQQATIQDPAGDPTRRPKPIEYSLLPRNLVDEAEASSSD